MINTLQPTVLIMAAGTGGHVFPALALAQALQDQNINVEWLGTRQGLEARILPNAGLAQHLHCINIRGLRGKNALSLLTAPFKILQATWQTWRILRTYRPSLVIGMGGYVTGPGAFAAWLARIPLIIHEQNAIPGLTNRWLARLFARQVLTAFPNTFPKHPHTLHLGNPLRSDILAIPPRTQVHSPLHILIIGGSLGAKALNDTIPQALYQLKLPIEVWHQTGETHIADMRTAYAQAPFKATVEGFIQHMGYAYQWADLVICRAGALTVSELAQAGVASLLIPYPHAVDDHQTHNARFLAEQGAAILISQTELTVAHLSQQLNELLTDSQRLLNMGKKAAACAMPQALTQMTKLCLEQISS